MQVEGTENKLLSEYEDDYRLDLLCEDMERQQQFFDGHLEELLARYHGEYIAVAGEEVVAHGPDPQEVHVTARERVQRTFPGAVPHRAVLTRKCQRDEEAAEQVIAIPSMLRGSIVGE